MRERAPILVLALLAVMGCNGAPSSQGIGHVIAGRVVDHQGPLTDDAILMVGRGEGDTDRSRFTRIPVPLRTDGSFVTERLPPATYVLEVVRSPHSRTEAATTVGLTIVTVGLSDITDVMVVVRPDVAVAGSFRMESDNPAAKWPPHLQVTAQLVLEDGTHTGNSTTAQGASGGRFVLKNVFGHRILRTGYTLDPGNPWWPKQVLLDGVDVTNVPTDFSENPTRRLEVVFTQHP